MTLREAAQMALEALEHVYGKGKKCDAAITALRQALKQQPADEPKWYHGVDVYGCNRFYHHDEVRPSEFSTPLYTHPPQRKPLTDDEIDDIWNKYCDEMGEASINDAYDIARAIEQAHGIGEQT